MSCNVVAGSTSYAPQAHLDICLGGSSNGSTRVGDSAITHFYGTESKPRWGIGRDFLSTAQAAFGLGAGGSSPLDIFIGRDGSGNLLFQTNSGSTHNTRMTITSGGSIGIGITSPLTQLHVVGYGIFTNSTSSTTSSAYIRGLNAYSAATNPDYTWYSNDQTGLFHPSSNIIGLTINGSEKMRLTTNGLLIGTTTDPGGTSLVINAPSNYWALYSTTTFSADYAYHQVNKVNRANTKALVIQQGSTDMIDLWGSGHIDCVSLTQTSDKTLKENIDTLRNALTKVKLLKGVTYNLKTSFTGLSIPKREMGLLAQDVELIVPEVVSTNDKGLKSIAYSNLVALVIEALKEEDAKILLLQQTINNTGASKRTVSSEQTTSGTEVSDDINELKKMLEAQQKDIEFLKKQNAELSIRLEKLNK